MQVVAKDSGERVRVQTESFRRYFYGFPQESMVPKRFDVPFSAVRILKIGGLGMSVYG
jgi:hypothetical protein